MLSTGEDVNILVLDTEEYSNTGGQKVGVVQRRCGLAWVMGVGGGVGGAVLGGGCDEQAQHVAWKGLAALRPTVCSPVRFALTLPRPTEQVVAAGLGAHACCRRL